MVMIMMLLKFSFIYDMYICKQYLVGLHIVSSLPYTYYGLQLGLCEEFKTYFMRTANLINVVNWVNTMKMVTHKPYIHMHGNQCLVQRACLHHHQGKF